MGVAATLPELSEWTLRFCLNNVMFIVHSLSSGKVEMFHCAACHAFTPHVSAWKR